jgi:dienelactone hydrolase
VWDYLAAHGDEVVAAAVPIAGHAMWALEKAGCEPLATVPVWAFHGAMDEIVPVSYVEGQRDQIRACEGAESVEMELTIYPDAYHVDNNAWDRTYDLSARNDIYAWMLEHTNESVQ